MMMRAANRCLLLTAVLLGVIVCLPVLAAPRKKKGDSKKEKPMVVPAGVPAIFELQPRGIQRGTSVEVQLIGTNLIGLTELNCQSEADRRIRPRAGMDHQCRLDKNHRCRRSFPWRL